MASVYGGAAGTETKHWCDACYGRAVAAMKDGNLDPEGYALRAAVDVATEHLRVEKAQAVELARFSNEENARLLASLEQARETNEKLRELRDTRDAAEMNREICQERCAMVAEVLGMLGKKARAKHAERIAEIERFLVLESRPVADPIKEAVRRARVERAQIENSTGPSFLQRCRDAEIAHDEEERRETCGRETPYPGYLPCRRPPHDDGPCAHEPKHDSYWWESADDEAVDKGHQ